MASEEAPTREVRPLSRHRHTLLSESRGFTAGRGMDQAPHCQALPAPWPGFARRLSPPCTASRPCWPSRCRAVPPRGRSPPASTLPSLAGLFPSQAHFACQCQLQRMRSLAKE